MKGLHAEEREDFAATAVCNRRPTESVALCVQIPIGFCHAFVQSAISQGFDCPFYYKGLELDHLIAHAFERALPTHEAAVWPAIIFALTFKHGNRKTGSSIQTF